MPNKSSRSRKRILSDKCKGCGRIKSSESCAFCQSRLQCSPDPDVFEISVCTTETDDSESPVNYPDEVCCYACRRISTIYHHLDFQLVQGIYICNRQKFRPAKTTEIVPLCQTCNIYLNPEAEAFATTATFKHAWPCVFWYMLSTEDVSINFWQNIPIEMRSSWINKTALSNIVFWSRMELVSVPVFADLTNRRQHFDKFKQEWLLNDMVKSVNEEYFPCVKCPVGCEEFIDECGSISFVHYLGKIVPNFNKFETNPNDFLRGIRSDYELTDYLFDSDPRSPFKKPSIVIDNTGISILTCRDHDKKVKDYYIHVPRHPSGRVFNPLADRFAPAVLSTRVRKPFQEKFSTASYKMLQLNHSFSGINTCFLSEQRNFDRVTDESIEHVSFYLHTRKDTEIVLKKLVQNGSLSQKIGEAILKNRNERWLAQTEQFLNHTNFVPLETVSFIRYINQYPNINPMTTIEEQEEEEVEEESLGDESSGYIEDVDHQAPCGIDYSQESTSGTSVVESADTSGSNTLQEANFCQQELLQRIVFPCVKPLDRTLGAPPKTFVVGSDSAKILIDMSANSVLFMSNVLQASLRKMVSLGNFRIVSMLKKEKLSNNPLLQPYKIYDMKLTRFPCTKFCPNCLLLT